MKTIIFISGWSISPWLAKSILFWNDSVWKNYNRVYISSKTPTSDRMVQEELNNLSNIINQHTNVILAGHSLGAWWAANLACETRNAIEKLVFWTPLSDVDTYPIFTASEKYHPMNKVPNSNILGKKNSLLFEAKYDLIVPPEHHCHDLLYHFDAYKYTLYGGHALQLNHKKGLQFMRSWIGSS